MPPHEVLPNTASQGTRLFGKIFFLPDITITAISFTFFWHSPNEAHTGLLNSVWLSCYHTQAARCFAVDTAYIDV